MSADDIEVIHMTAVEVERLKADLEDAYAERDQQFERKVAALRERDEAKQQLAEAQRTIAAHERHINDMFEANRCGLQLARDQRDEAQDERDELKAETELLRADLAKAKRERDFILEVLPDLDTHVKLFDFDDPCVDWCPACLRAERDALKAAIGQLASTWKVEARKATARVAKAGKYVEEVRWNAWAAAYGCHADELLAALAAPETPGDADVQA